MKVKKAQLGKSLPKKKAAVDSVESEMFPGKMIPKSKSNYETGKIGKMAQAGKPAVKSAPKKKAKAGASLKPVPADKQKSLGKLPTPVRNKMGFQKNGGKVVNKSKKK